MDDFFAMPPWWVVAGLAAALVVAGVRFVRWTGRVDTRIETLTSGMAEVREDIKKILGRLPATPPTVQSHSPVRLTDFGRKISAAASAAKWAESHAPNLAREVPGKPEFEVFDLCVAYVEERFEDDEDFRRNVRATAYEYGAELEQVRKVYHVELRDRVLALSAAA